MPQNYTISSQKFGFEMQVCIVHYTFEWCFAIKLYDVNGADLNPITSQGLHKCQSDLMEYWGVELKFKFGLVYDV